MRGLTPTSAGSAPGEAETLAVSVVRKRMAKDVSFMVVVMVVVGGRWFC